jgi:hypothetical protein
VQLLLGEGMDAGGAGACVSEPSIGIRRVERRDLESLLVVCRGCGRGNRGREGTKGITMPRGAAARERRAGAQNHARQSHHVRCLGGLKCNWGMFYNDTHQAKEFIEDPQPGSRPYPHEAPGRADRAIIERTGFLPSFRKRKKGT